MTGQRLLHYQVIEKLGEGGMGVVYKARDTHLDRFVAIKVLPPEKVSDPTRKARFVQEAKAASALNHPNIITIYDIASDDGIDFIAMEFVDGETLDQLIPRKGMRLNEALKVAIQIADALARAHAVGIIHRDLKPANIMVDAHGQVKVLDFGLAKLTERGEPSEASTATAAVKTDEGTIAGTAAYMSPEQAEGKPVDARSDIFSFGAVLHEVISGRPVFQRDSRISTLAAVIRDEPPPLADEVPAELARLVSRCLRKDPARRFQHMDDLRVALAELQEESASGASVPVPATRRRRRWIWRGLGAAGVLILGFGVLYLLLRSPRTPPQSPRNAQPITSYPGFERQPSFSPDGNEIAFSWNGAKQENFDIYRKLIGTGDPLRLTSDPAPDYCPAWSPDGRQIAYLHSPPQGKSLLRIIPALGGAARTLNEISAPPWRRSAWDSCLAWTADGKWLIGPNLQIVSVESGEIRLLAPRTGVSGWDLSPALSPDGRTLAFVRRLDFGVCDIYLLSLASGYQPSGEPRRITYEAREVGGPVWIASGKEIAYASGNIYSERRLFRVPARPPAEPRDYRPDPLPGGDGAYTMALSRDGRRLAYVREVWDSDVYRFPLDGRPDSSRTPEKLLASTGLDLDAEYSPDGRQIAFSSTRSGSQEIWIAEADGTRPRQLTAMGGALTGSPRWSPDGRAIVFDSRREGSGDLYLISPDGGVPRLLAGGPGYQGEPRWSKDGRWIYFHTGGQRGQLFKIPAQGGSLLQLTREGGGPARESPDGRRIYYGKGGGLWKMPAAGGEETQVLQGLSWPTNFAVTPGGIYYIPGDPARFGDQPLRIEFHDFVTSSARLVLQTGGLWHLGLSISPDNRWIAFSQFDQVGGDILLVENFR